MIDISSFLAVDCESTGLDFNHGCQVFAVSMCDSDHQTFYWEADVDPYTRTPHWSEVNLRQIEKKIRSSKVLVFHNLLFDVKALLHLLPTLQSHFAARTTVFHDTMVMSHLVDSKAPKNLKDQALLRLGISDTDEEVLNKAIKKLRFLTNKLRWDVARKGHPHFPGATSGFHKMDMWMARAYAKFKRLPKSDSLWSMCGEYAIMDAIRTAGLFYVFSNTINLSKETLAAYYLQQEVFLPLVAMELTGIDLLPDEFNELAEEYQTQADEFKNDLIEIAANVGVEDFNPNSGAQLQEVLFNRFDFFSVKQTKTGFSTDKNVLSRLTTQENTFQAKRFVSSLLKYRATNTTLTYQRSYERFKVGYKLYPSANQVGTSTTRISMSAPNGQNVGRGREAEELDEDGHKVINYSLRKMFGPPPGKFWLSIDYDQLQIRIFAYLSGERSLIDAIEAGFDFHHVVACDIYDTDTPSKEQRKTAKYVNFALIFGAGEARVDSLAGFVGAYQKYRKRYPNVTSYIEKMSSEARKNGFIRTPSGYPLSVPRNKSYVAVNYQVQGGEGDIVKRAFSECSRILNTVNSYSLQPVALQDSTWISKGFKLLLQIHDELLFEFSEGSEVPLKELVDAMESAGDDFGVPCKCKPELIITNWAEGVPISINHFEKGTSNAKSSEREGRKTNFKVRGVHRVRGVRRKTIQVR